MEGKTFGELLQTEEPSEAEPVKEAVETQTEEAPAPEEAAERPRNPDGTFAKKGDDEGAPPAPEEKQEFDGAATLAERRKRQEAETRLAELEKQIQALQQQPAKPQEPVQSPDMFADPEGWQQHLTGQFQAALYEQSFVMSDRFARQQHGDELVNEALEWGKRRCDADPYFNQQVASSGDPVGYAVREYQRSQIVESVTPEDYAKFREWQQQQQAAPAPAPEPPKPPPTLTGERNLGTRGEPAWKGPSTFGEILGR